MRPGRAAPGHGPGTRFSGNAQKRTVWGLGRDLGRVWPVGRSREGAGWVTSRVADGPAAPTQNVQQGLSLGRGDSASTRRGRMEKSWGLVGRSGEQ